MIVISVGISTHSVFVPAAVALIVVPGLDLLYVLTRSIATGPSTGLSSTLGICTGILAHTIAAVFGLSALFRTSSLAYSLLKYASAVYLLYLGVQSIRRKERFEFRTGDIDADIGADYWRGVVINTLNPKLRCSFSRSSRSSLRPDRVKAVLANHPRAPDVIRWGAGSVIVGFDIKLAASDNTPV